VQPECDTQRRADGRLARCSGSTTTCQPPPFCIPLPKADSPKRHSQYRRLDPSDTRGAGGSRRGIGVMTRPRRLSRAAMVGRPGAGRGGGVAGADPGPASGRCHQPRWRSAGRQRHLVGVGQEGDASAATASATQVSSRDGGLGGPQWLAGSQRKAGDAPALRGTTGDPVFPASCPA
jgi:hypothetical protein